MAALLGTAAIALAANTVRVGPGLPGGFDFGKGCGGLFESCTYFQNRLANGPSKAPFNGTVTRWKLQGGNGDYRLQVLKPQGGGSYVVKGQTPPETITQGSDVVSAFPSNVAIKKGWHVALREEGSASILTEEKGAENCARTLTPALGVGGSAEHNPGFGGCELLLRFNATIRR